MTDILFVVNDKTSLTTGDTALRGILTGEGYTVTNRDLSESEVTSGYDGAVIGPSCSWAINTNKYLGDDFPVISTALTYYCHDSELTTAATSSPISDGTEVSYRTASVFTWTDQTPVSNVVIASATGNVAYGGAPSNGVVGILGNRSFPTVRYNCYALDAGDTGADGTTTHTYKIGWLGWKPRLDADNLNAAGEQFIVDFALWAFGGAGGAGGILARPISTARRHLLTR